MNKSREELLKRWSELAPGEDVAFAAFMASDEDPRGPAPALARAVLFTVLIEAIRARKWWADIEITATGTVRVAVAIKKLGGTQRLYEGQNAEPCDAALTAYVQALEAVK